MLEFDILLEVVFFIGKEVEGDPELDGSPLILVWNAQISSASSLSSSITPFEMSQIVLIDGSRISSSSHFWLLI